jgi:hypothetical protein
MAKQQQQEPAPSWDGVLRRSLDIELRAVDGVLRRSLDIELRAVDEEERSVEVIASTDTLDGHGDVVEQTFDLKRYKKNPVVLWLHNSFGFFDGARAEDFLPIGHAENVKIEGGNLVAKLIFVKGDGEDSLPEKVWRRVQQRALRAVSIGFRPGKVTRTENNDTGKVTYRLANNELFEISVVPVPSNPDAVAKALHAAEREQLSRLAAEPAAPGGVHREKTMNEELQKALEAKAVAEQKAKDAEARAGTAEQKAKTLDTELSTEREAHTKLKAEVEPLKKRASDAEEKLVGLEVDALVGKKIQPAQRDKFVKLRKSQGAEEFAEFVKDMPDLPTLKSITGSEKDTENHAKSGGTPKSIAARLEKVGS